MARSAEDFIMNHQVGNRHFGKRIKDITAILRRLTVARALVARSIPFFLRIIPATRAWPTGARNCCDAAMRIAFVSALLAGVCATATAQGFRGGGGGGPGPGGGFTPPSPEDSFRRMDTNQNGQLDPEEVQALPGFLRDMLSRSGIDGSRPVSLKEYVDNSAKMREQFERTRSSGEFRRPDLSGGGGPPGGGGGGPPSLRIEEPSRDSRREERDDRDRNREERRESSGSSTKETTSAVSSIRRTTWYGLSGCAGSTPASW